MFKKNTFIFFFCIANIVYLNSCIFAVLSNRSLGIDRAEYVDTTHFLLYFSGTETETGLPDKESLFISDEFAYKAIPTHSVVNIKRDWWDILLGGYLYQCEVTPPFESGEKVCVWVEDGTYYEDIDGYAEFIVP